MLLHCGSFLSQSVVFVVEVVSLKHESQSRGHSMVHQICCKFKILIQRHLALHETPSKVLQHLTHKIIFNKTVVVCLLNDY